MQEGKKASCALWPGIISLLLLLACFWCAWLVYAKHSEMAREAEDQKAQYLEMQEDAEGLRKLLRLSPCEAKDKYANHVSQNDMNFAPAGKNLQYGEAARVAATSPAPTIANIENACVFIVGFPNKNKLATGTGFFVAPGYILTNRHVVDKSDPPIARLLWPCLPMICSNF